MLTRAALSLASGTITALHGANGSGKSTLARVIAGLHPAHLGRVFVDGKGIVRHRFIGGLDAKSLDDVRRALVEAAA